MKLFISKRLICQYDLSPVAESPGSDQTLGGLPDSVQVTHHATNLIGNHM